MQSRAATVADYLASLPEDRRRAVEAVRAVILENLDADYAEAMSYGMIGYGVPHRVYPAGYHADPRQPLPFAALASQKAHLSLYLMPLNGGDAPEPAEYLRWFREAWAASGKKLDLGKACIRFKRLEDVPLAVIGEAVRRVPAKTYVGWYEGVAGKARAAKGGAGKAKPAADDAGKAKAPKGGAGKAMAAKGGAAKAAGAKAAGAKAAGAKAAG
ncbi:MAG TPA: DUF1801 domain-containing protein, partial [Polyangiaceae bacterium]|nr:DUF1801 domain-containing protein [Polyangiaceae bacterium]